MGPEQRMSALSFGGVTRPGIQRIPWGKRNGGSGRPVGSANSQARNGFSQGGGRSRDAPRGLLSHHHPFQGTGLPPKILPWTAGWGGLKGPKPHSLKELEMGNQLAPILLPLEPLCPQPRPPGVACLPLLKALATDFKSGSSPLPTQLPPPSGGIKYRRVIFKTSSSP